MKNIFYELSYEYYQYNSGLADNGKYQKIIVFKESEYADALKVAKQILLSIEDNLEEEENQNLKNDLILYSGFFLKVQLVESIRSDTVINLIQQEENHAIG